MQLETKRLIIRIPKKSDWKDIVEGVGEFDVAKMLISVPYPYFKKDADGFIKRKIIEWKQKTPNNCQFFIELKSEKKVIGGIGITKIDYFSKTGETGSWINKKYWRNRYMTETKIAVNDFAFNKLGLNRLTSYVFANNKASNATQLKMGYKFEGTKRKCVKSKTSGIVHDENIYGLLKEDWKKIRPKLIKEIKTKK